MVDDVQKPPINSDSGAEPQTYTGNHVTHLADDMVGEQAAEIALDQGHAHTGDRHEGAHEGDPLAGRQDPGDPVNTGLRAERRQQHAAGERSGGVTPGHPEMQGDESRLNADAENEKGKTARHRQCQLQGAGRTVL